MKYDHLYGRDLAEGEKGQRKRRNRERSGLQWSDHPQRGIFETEREEGRGGERVNDTRSSLGGMVSHCIYSPSPSGLVLRGDVFLYGRTSWPSSF